MSFIRIGIFAENIVEDYLIEHGYSILERNFIIKGVGEIDFICKDADDTIIIVEVKARKKNFFSDDVTPGHFISRSKINKIYNTFYSYCKNISFNLKIVRFDVIEVFFESDYLSWNIKHNKNIDLN